MWGAGVAGGVGRCPQVGSRSGLNPSQGKGQSWRRFLAPIEILYVQNFYTRNFLRVGKVGADFALCPKPIPPKPLEAFLWPVRDSPKSVRVGRHRRGGQWGSRVGSGVGGASQSVGWAKGSPKVCRCARAPVPSGPLHAKNPAPSLRPPLPKVWGWGVLGVASRVASLASRSVGEWGGLLSEGLYRPVWGVGV